MAKFAKQTGALLVHFSTDYVFDGNTPEPLDEQSPTNPRSIYGLSKRAGECAIEITNPFYLIFRLSSLYGSDSQGTLGVLKQLKEGKGTPDAPINVLDQFTAPTSVDTVARIVSKLLGDATDPARVHVGNWREVSGIYHLVDHAPCWKVDLAQKTIFLATGKSAVVTEGKLTIPRPRYLNLSTLKFRTTFPGIGATIPTVEDDMRSFIRTRL